MIVLKNQQPFHICSIAIIEKDLISISIRDIEKNKRWFTNEMKKPTGKYPGFIYVYKLMKMEGIF